MGGVEECIRHMSLSQRTCQSLEAQTAEEHAAIEALTTALHNGLRSLTQIQEAEKKDRLADLEEIKKVRTTTDEQLLQVFSHLSGEREHRMQDIKSTRSMCQTFNRHMLKKFEEEDRRLNAESAERKDLEHKLEKRFAELRGTVLVALRGSCPNKSCRSIQRIQ